VACETMAAATVALDSIFSQHTGQVVVMTFCKNMNYGEAGLVMEAGC